MKKLICIMAVTGLLLTGCSKDLQVKSADKLTIEYGDKLDHNKLFTASESDEKVKVDKVAGYNAKKLGDQTLKVTFTDGNKKVDKEIKITVKDTKKPEITLKKDKITIIAGDKLDLKDNIKSVKDPVDGDLKYSEKEIKKFGYYIDKGKLDTNKEGSYEVTVKAIDMNRNISEAKFKIIVEKRAEKKEEEKTSSAVTDQGQNNEQTEQQAPAVNSPTTNQAPVNNREQNTGETSGGSSSGNSVNNKPVEIPKPQTCTVPETEYGYGSMVFATESEAEAYGSQMQEDPANNIVSFDYGPMFDTCNNVVGYSVDFNYAK